MFAPAESVTLNARTIPLRDSARRISGSRSVPFGGFNSVVTTNSPELSASENVSNGDSLIAYTASQLARIIVPLYGN